MDLDHCRRNVRYRADGQGGVQMLQDGDFVGRLNELLRRQRYHRDLEKIVRRHLPENLAPYCKVACEEDGELVLYAESAVVANRVKMLAPQMAYEMENIHSVTVRIVPPNNPPVPEVQRFLPLSPQSRAVLEDTARQLEKYPQLAAAMRRLAAVARKL